MAPISVLDLDYGFAQCFANRGLQNSEANSRAQENDLLTTVISDWIQDKADHCPKEREWNYPCDNVETGIRRSNSTVQIASTATHNLEYFIERHRQHRTLQKNDQRRSVILATIWRCAEEYFDNNSPEIESYFDEPTTSDNLFSSPEAGDWHIIYSFQDVQRRLRKTSSHAECLEAFPPAVSCDEIRYLRCGKSELLDATCWLSWQHSTAPSDLLGGAWPWDEPDDTYVELSKQEVKHCKTVLLEFLHSRSIDDLQLILLAIYFANHSFRNLLISEWTAAVRSIASAELASSSSPNVRHSRCFRDEELLAMCNPLLQADSDGKIIFQEYALKKYLKLVELPGLERGHGMMAQMCFTQIKKVATRLIVRPWHDFRLWSTSCTEWPCMSYVLRFWPSHYKLAAESRHDLTAELLHMVNDALVGQHPATTSSLLQQDVVNVGLRIAQAYELPILADTYRNMGASQTSHDAKVTHMDIMRRRDILFDVSEIHDVSLSDETWPNGSQSNSFARAEDDFKISTRLQELHLDAIASHKSQKGFRNKDGLSEYQCSIASNWESIEAAILCNQADEYDHFGGWEFVTNQDSMFCDSAMDGVQMVQM